MKSAILIALASLTSIGASWPQPALEDGQIAQPPNAVETLLPRDYREKGFNAPHGRWLLHRRDETTTVEEAETTTATTADSTETGVSDAATTADAATTTTVTATSTESQTTATASTTDSTTSSSASSTQTTQSTSTASTTTASTTTSTATATSTASADLAEENRKGKIAAIITFTILGSIFIGICVISRMRTAMRRKRKAVAEETKKLTEGGSMYNLEPVADENARPATTGGSERTFDRESIMFANGSSTPRGSTYFDPSMNLNVPQNHSRSGSGSQSLNQGYARSGSTGDLGQGSNGQSPLQHSFS